MCDRVPVTDIGDNATKDASNVKTAHKLFQFALVDNKFTEMSISHITGNSDKQ